MTASSRRATYVFLAVLLLFALFGAFTIFEPFLRPAAYALVLAVGGYPIHTFVRRYISGRSRPALLTTILLLVTIIVPMLILGHAISKDAKRVMEYVHNTGRSEIYARYQQTQDHMFSWISAKFGVDRDTIAQKVREMSDNAARSTFVIGTAVVGGAAGFITETGLTFVFLFFFLRDGHDWLNSLASLLPLSADRVQRLFKIIQDTIVASLYGILGVAFVQGALTCAGLWIAGFSAAPLLGMLAGICSVIPLVGTGLVWGPAGLYLLLAHETGKGIFLLIWGLLVVNPTDNVIRPLVLYGRVKLYPMLLIFSLLGGILKFGLLGAFIGPLLVALAIAATEMIREQPAQPEQAEEVTVAIIGR
jgi:predicted PurR-regulated permease PerM